jgi:hypothetical protein
MQQRVKLGTLTGKLKKNPRRGNSLKAVNLAKR